MVTRQHTPYNMDAHFIACLPDDFAHTLAHRALQNLVAIFRHSHDMEPVVKSRVRGR